MISSTFFIEVIASILLLVSYFVFFFIKYRKQPGFLSSLLWGIGGFFVANAIYNVVLIAITSVLGEERLISLIEGSDIAFVLLTTFALAVGASFAVIFVSKMQKKRGTFIEGNTEEVTGMAMGAGLITPPFGQSMMINASLMYFVTLFINGFVINQSPTLEELGENFTQEMWKELVASFQAIKFLEVFYLAVITLIMAFSYIILYKLIERVFSDKPTWMKFVVPTMMMWSFLFLASMINVLTVASFVKLILALVLGGLLFYGNKVINDRGVKVDVIDPQ